MIASAISHGFTVADFEHLTVGMVFDAVSEFIPEKEQVRKATQEDIRKLKY